MSGSIRSSVFVLVAGITAGLVAPLTAEAVTESTAPPVLKEFYDQQPTWAPCVVEPVDLEGQDAGSQEATKKVLPTLECAKIKVPLNYKDPDGERLSLAISRLKAEDESKRKGVVLYNPGGPGGSGLPFPAAYRDSQFRDVYDVVSFDPRGVGRSSGLRCEVTPGLAPSNSRPTDAEFAAWAAEARAKEEACDRAGGGIRPYINTSNTARDMDIIRGVLGEKKINYLGTSYGTYLGAVYGTLFPQNLARSVLDSSVHPEWIWREQFKNQAVAARENVDAWAKWISERNESFGLGRTQQEVMGTIEKIAKRLDQEPLAVLGVKLLDRRTFDFALGYGARYRPQWQIAGWIVGALEWATRPGDASAPSEATTKDAAQAAKVLASLGIAETSKGVFDTVTCEVDWPRDLNTYYDDMRVYREKYPYGVGVGAAAPKACTFRSYSPDEWPPYVQRSGYQTGIVIQAEGDTQTRYDGGAAMAQRLRNQLVSVSDEGAHGLYGHNTCATDIVDAYFVDGVLPASRVTCAGDPRPNVPTDEDAALVAPLSPTGLEAKVRQFIADSKLEPLAMR